MVSFVRRNSNNPFLPVWEPARAPSSI